jgi:hypothetical protein
MAYTADQVRFLPILPAHERRLKQATAVIAEAGSLSGAVDCGNQPPVAIIMPAAWTAADLTFQVSADGTTWGNLYDENASTRTETSLKAAANDIIRLDPNKWGWVRHLKIRSGTAASAVAQAAARTLTVVLR